MARSIKKTPIKNRGAKPGAKKTASKKPVAKKKAAKKVLAKKKTSAGTARKKASASRITPGSSQKPGVRKKGSSKKAAVDPAKKKLKKVNKETVPELTNQNLPPVEEKSLNLAPDMKFAPGMDRRSQLKAANRNYGTPNSGISHVKKGGIKPTGKKPLW